MAEGAMHNNNEIGKLAQHDSSPLKPPFSCFIHNESKFIYSELNLIHNDRNWIHASNEPPLFS